MNDKQKHIKCVLQVKDVFSKLGKDHPMYEKALAAIKVKEEWIERTYGSINEKKLCVCEINTLMMKGCKCEGQ